MIGTAARYAAITTICAALATQVAWADDTPTEEDASAASGLIVKDSAQTLKDADDISLAARQLRPIALENLPAKIDVATILSSIPGSVVSAQAQGLRGLDRSAIPGAAKALRGTAAGALPGPAASRTTGAHTPSLPSAARGRGRR